MDYRQFSAVDLATDPAFIVWVKYPDDTNTAFWENFLVQNPDRAGTVAAGRQLLVGFALTPPIPSVGSKEQVWMKIKAEAGINGEERRNPGLNYFIGSRPFMRYAAVLVGALLLAAAGFWLANRSTPSRYVTEKGETKTITLPDNSTVVLGSHSSLAIVGDWKPEHPRELRLEGEGYFSVTHQQNHQPFIVQTGRNVRVEVLGTRFTVAERATKTQVVLNAGKVALYLDKAAVPLLMKPGELIDIPQSGTRQLPITRRTVKPEVYSAWTENEFLFENTSLGEVATILESEFGQKMVFASDSLKSLRITLRLPTRNLDLLLAAVSEIHDLEMERKPGQILVKPVSATP